MALDEASPSDPAAQASVVLPARRGRSADLLDLDVTAGVPGSASAPMSDSDLRRIVEDVVRPGPVDSPEQLAIGVGHRIREAGSEAVAVSVTRHMWRRLTVDGADVDDAFVQRTAEQHTATVAAGAEPAVRSGVRGLGLAWVEGPDEAAAILLASVEASWSYHGGDVAYMDAWRTIRRALTEAFGRAVGTPAETLADLLAETVVTACPHVRESVVRLRLPDAVPLAAGHGVMVDERHGGTVASGAGGRPKP